MQQPQNTPIPIVCLDPIVHTPTHPFCADLTCPDKQDPELQAELWRRINAGEITPGQALTIYWGLQDE